MRRIIVLFLIAGLTAAPLVAQDLNLGSINPGASNTRMASQGHVTNELDWLISPTGLSRFAESATLFFALDADADQFGEGLVGDGFRGGWAGPLAGLTVSTVLNYRFDETGNSQEETENVDLTYEDYDQATGEYATLTQTVNISSGDVSSNHDLLVHLGAGLGDGMGVNLQVYWERNRAIVEMLDYINDYENTGAPSDATMTSRRPRTATSVNMDESDPGELRIEPEFGLQSGSFTTHNALSFTLFNMLGQDRFQETESRYDLGFGTDDTALDQEEITVTAGQYTWDGANPNAAIVMNTNIPTVNASLIMGLDSRNYLDGVLGGVLGIPFQASVTLYPGDEQFSRETVTTVTYDDAVATPRETEREVVTTTTSLDEALAMSFVSGAQLLKTIPAGETAAVHLGVDLDVSYWRETLQKSQARTTRTQVDGNTDGDYADAGTDVDTTYTESGYVITAQNGGFWVSMGLPLAVSYTPFPALTFYAGTTTSAQVNVTSSRSLEEGIGTAGAPEFVYEQYTDNLEAANSYSQRVIDGSETNTLPDQATSTTTSFSASADFGFTLDLSEQVTVDARATSSGSLGFEQFSVTAIYRY